MNVTKFRYPYLFITRMNKFKLSTGDIKYMCFFHRVNTTLISLQFTEDYKEIINAKSKDVWKGTD